MQKMINPKNPTNLTNPNKPDFGKFKFGNTRFDFGGAFLQYIRLGAQLIYDLRHQNEPKWSMAKGTAADVALRFIRGKTAPIPSFVWNWLAGEDSQEASKPFNFGTEVARLFIPMASQDTAEAIKEWGPLHPIAIASAVATEAGVGVQTYEAKMPRFKGLGSGMPGFGTRRGTSFGTDPFSRRAC